MRSGLLGLDLTRLARREDRVTLDLGKPNAIQRQVLKFFREGKRFVLMVAGRQSGKSHIGARWLILQTMNPNAKEKLAFAVAPTYKMARVIVRKLNEVLQSHPDLWKKIEYKAGPPATYTFPNGWVIEVHSSDNPDSLRGPTVSAVWFDEIAAADEEAFDILTPTLLASGGSLFGTTTPRGVENWVYYRLHEKSIPPGAPGHKPDSYHPMYASATGSTWDNVENLTEEAVQMLENQYGEGSVFGKQELYGEFVSFEGLVYRWDAHNTLPVDEMPKLSEYSHIVGGIDFGWTDPASATVLGYKDGQWYAIDEVYGSEIEINDLATRIGDLHSRYRVSRWYADSARPDLISDLNTRGIPVLPVKKPKIEDRIREMAAFTDNHGLKVSTNCPNVIRELTLYRWPEKKRRDGSGAAVPVDENNHSMDGIGYAIWSMRWLWRNDVAAKERLEKKRKDVDIEEEQFQRWKRKHGFGKRKRYGYAGLLGR